jgi:hypothetical protein
MEVFKKLQQAKEKIKKSDLKKEGRNEYSKYDYFTPEQVDKLVFEAAKEFNLFNSYQLKRTEFGLVAQLKVIDLDSGKSEIFEIATEIPEIKATNIAQQLGGAVTYSKRYLLMSTYDIVDNNLDFDSRTPQRTSANKTKSDDNKKWLNRTDKKGNVLPEYLKIVKKAKEKGLDANSLRDYYKISKIVFEQLKDDLKSDIEYEKTEELSNEEAMNRMYGEPKDKANNELLGEQLDENDDLPF